MTVPEVAWIGIDAGKLRHHATAIDNDGRVLWSQLVANDQAAIERLLHKATHTAGRVRWAVDLTSAAAALLLALLIAGGQQVVYVPGRVVNRMSGTFGGEGKTDARDARVIAETARMRRDLTELTTPDELVVELSLLTGHRADLLAEWVRGVNRLRDLLTRVFPALERALDYTTRVALVLVTGYCTPSAIRQAGPQGVSEFLQAQGARRVWIPATVRKALAAAQAQTVALPGEATTAGLASGLARRLLELDREIKDLDKLLARRFRTHPRRRSSRACPAWARRWARSSSRSPVAGTWRRLAPPPGWLPTPGSRPCPTTPAAVPGCCTARCATTAGCGTCSTWRPSPASNARARRERSTSANVPNGSATPRP
jgi:Transposase